MTRPPGKLFECPDDPPPVKAKANGCPWPPGSGPKGETCKTCRNLYRIHEGGHCLP